MATQMGQVLGSVYAYEYALEQESAAGEVTSQAVFIPPNVAQVSLGIRRLTGSGRYKVQVTYSTRDEIYGTSTTSPNAKWFNWDIPGTNGDGWYADDEVQWWIPIPSGIRLVNEAGTGTTVYWSMRAN